MTDDRKDSLVVSVNNVVISEQAILKEMQYHPAGSRDQAYQLAARALVVKELLLQQAAQKGIGETTEMSDSETPDETRIRQLVDSEVETPEADEKACRTYYISNLGRFKTWPLIQVRHILIPAFPKDIEGRREAKKLGDSLVQKLSEDLELFPQLAKQYSACPSKDQGGDLGQIDRGQTTPEFERQLFVLREGLATRPLETRYGYHVVEIQRREEGQTLEFEQVKNKIAEYLNQRVRRKATSQYIGFLIGEASITGVNMDGADSMLIQ